MLRRLAKRHPLLVAVLGFVIIEFPQWLQGIWGLFSKAPLAPILEHWLKARRMPHFSAHWITLPLGCFVLIWVVVETWNTRRHRLADTSQHPRLTHRRSSCNRL